MIPEKFLEKLDIFAAAAMTGYLAHHGSSRIYTASDDSTRWAADMAYADALNMLTARDEMIQQLEKDGVL